MPRPCPCCAVKAEQLIVPGFLSQGSSQVEGSFKLSCCQHADVEQIYIASSMFGTEMLRWWLLPAGCAGAHQH